MIALRLLVVMVSDGMLLPSSGSVRNESCPGARISGVDGGGDRGGVLTQPAALTHWLPQCPTPFHVYLQSVEVSKCVRACVGVGAIKAHTSDFSMQQTWSRRSWKPPSGSGSAGPALPPAAPEKCGCLSTACHSAVPPCRARHPQMEVL